MTPQEEQQLHEALEELTKAYLNIAHLKVRCEGYERENMELRKKIAELENK